MNARIYVVNWLCRILLTDLISINHENPKKLMDF
jgi:hypothetical protein